MASAMDMALDDVIAAERTKNSSKQSNTRRTGRMLQGKRGNTRSSRSERPYESRPRTNNRATNKAIVDGSISIKFLVSSAVAGAVIGKGGQNKSQLEKDSSAQILVSNNRQVYPGTTLRIIQIVGSEDAVSFAQQSVWKVIAQNRESTGPSGKFDEFTIEGQVSIPASQAGLVIGKGGANMRYLIEHSGVTCSMSDKDEALDSQERVLSVSGTVEQCSEFCVRLVSRLAQTEDRVGFVFQVGGYGQVHDDEADGVKEDEPIYRFSYTLSCTFAADKPSFELKSTAVPMPARRLTVTIPNSHQHSTYLSKGSEMLSANTTYTLAVPDALIGNIVGPKGVVIKEVMAFSGASVKVSGRNEFVPGTRNRVVTVSGAPEAAQAAHTALTQLLMAQNTLA